MIVDGWGVFVSLLPLISALILAIVGYVISRRTRRGEQRDETLKLAPLEASKLWARIDELGIELEDLKKRNAQERATDRRAFAQILSAIARQWTAPEPPVLPAQPLEVLADTIPPRWFPQPRS